jgi:hypothetical protein
MLARFVWAALGAAALGLGSEGPSYAGASADYKAEPLKEACPPEFSEAVRKSLSPEGIRVLKPDGKPFFDFWFCSSLRVDDPRPELGVKYDLLKPGVLVGGARVHAQAGDFKNQKYAAGAYTLRYNIQPQDGDHQGTADTRDFLMLSQAASDPSAELMNPEAAAKLSAKAAGKKHPLVLYLAKMDPGAKCPAMVHEEQADRWLLECEVPVSKGPPMRLWVVLVGKAADF